MYYAEQQGMQISSTSKRVSMGQGGGKTHARCTTDLRQLGQLFVLHNPAQTEIGNHDIGVFVNVAEEEILGFQVWMEHH